MKQDFFVPFRKIFKTMNWSTYIDLFQQIIEKKLTKAPYDDPAYVNFVQLNERRQSRWLKKGKILPKLKELIEKITEKQTWVLITEPWCGDASHSSPFIFLLSELNENIHLEIQLRDGKDSEIDNYLTNGGKSIPKLIVRDKNGKDLFTWGARPKSAQDFVMEMKGDESLSAEEKKMQLQKWYNKNKGEALQRELAELFLVG